MIARSVISMLIAVGLLLACFASAEAAGAELTIAAASDLNFAFKEIVTEYEKSTGNHVKLTLGSSGNFYAQIQNGAPFDLYFSADIGYPKKLEEAGLVVPGSLYRYAVGRIVVWTGFESHINVAKGFDALREPTHQENRHCQSQTCSLWTCRGCCDGTFQGL